MLRNSMLTLRWQKYLIYKVCTSIVIYHVIPVTRADHVRTCYIVLRKHAITYRRTFIYRKSQYMNVHKHGNVKAKIFADSMIIILFNNTCSRDGYLVRTC